MKRDVRIKCDLHSAGVMRYTSELIVELSFSPNRGCCIRLLCFVVLSRLIFAYLCLWHVVLSPPSYRFSRTRLLHLTCTCRFVLLSGGRRPSCTSSFFPTGHKLRVLDQQQISDLPGPRHRRGPHQCLPDERPVLPKRYTAMYLLEFAR